GGVKREGGNPCEPQKRKPQNLAFRSGEKAEPRIRGDSQPRRRKRVEGGDAAFREDVAEPSKKKTEDQSPPVNGASPGQRPTQRQRQQSDHAGRNEAMRDRTMSESVSE